ncbi:MAG: DUF362 domain-containing protein [Chloroflexi bacterium]|nr:DUF362 domain-containing protein [Chloroflexota bacterium]
MINPESFAGRGKVAVLRTRPETVLDDYRRLMLLAEYQATLDPQVDTILKVNLSGATWYPACSTAPWQLEGVIRTLQQDGYSRLMAAHNRVIGMDAYEGEQNHGHKAITGKYEVEDIHLYEPEVEWIRYQPRSEMLVLPRVFPRGIYIPRIFIDRNIIHLPTVKTHVFTTISGAMKNAFGGLLNDRRYRAHSMIHETLVDLLMVQQHIHKGIFAVMDGTLAGDGAGPRAMRWHEKDVILASADQVAIDAIAAKLQGFDPLSLKFIRLAHDRNLGVGDPREIEIVGDVDVLHENWHFVQDDTLVSRGQKMIYHGRLKPLEKFLLRTPLFRGSYLASRAYHDLYWYSAIGSNRVQSALATKWGRLFQEYVVPPAEPGGWNREMLAAIAIGGASALVVGGILARKMAKRT